MAYNLERRQHPRKRFPHLLYVELEPANGGMVLNFSEHGFGFRAVKRVRPNQEVSFAFNLDDKRRLEGKGRLEWADKEGRVAGLQFTEVSDQFMAEMRAWIASSSENPSKGPKRLATAAPVAAAAGPSIAEPAERSRPMGQREAMARGASAKAVRSISSIASGPGFPAAPDFPSESLAPENGSAGATESMPWAAVLPPAVGFERKPSMAVPEASAQPAGITAAALFKRTPYEISPGEEPEPDEVAETAEPLSEPVEAPRMAAMAPPVAVEAAAVVEVRTAAALNQHAQALLQHFQHEEERLLASFRESAARVLRDSERQMFPIREAVQAQMKGLESSVASAEGSAKKLDQYPALLERAQQQALDRFQSQLQEVLHAHVMELRRRSETVMEEINTRVRSTALLPHRIRTSSGIVGTGIIVMFLALLFAFRHEAAGAFIWLGEQMTQPTPASETVNTPAPQASTTPTTKPKEEPMPAPTEALAAPKTVPPSPKDVRSLWNLVAKGDVSAEMTLGTMYFTGSGVTKNCSQARRLFTAAARKGNEEAKQKLAELDNGACA
jgi:PilZ domain